MGKETTDKQPDGGNIIPTETDTEAIRIKSDVLAEKTALEGKREALREQILGVENQLFLIDRLLYPDRYKPKQPEPAPVDDPPGIV